METTAALTEAQRNDIARSDFLFRTYGTASRGEFKAAARSGEFDHLFAALVAHEAEVKAAEKAAKAIKNDAWRAKNLPKLAAAKSAREEQEAAAKIALVREMKNAQARRDADRAAQEQMMQAPSTFCVTPATRTPKSGMPATGRITENDPSIYGSILLGYEGDTWEKFHRENTGK